MGIEITSRDTFEPTVVVGTFRDVVQEVELAASKSNHFVLFTEERPSGDNRPVALEMRNITRIRDEDDDHFVGS